MIALTVTSFRYSYTKFKTIHHSGTLIRCQFELINKFFANFYLMTTIKVYLDDISSKQLNHFIEQEIIGMRLIKRAFKYEICIINIL